MITDLKFPMELARPVGLQEAELRGLRPIVVLAGPNGAGKSRYLGLVEQVVGRFHVLLSRRRDLQQTLERQGSIKYWETSQALEAVEQELIQWQSQTGFIRLPQDQAPIPKTIWLRYSLQSGCGGEPLLLPPQQVEQAVDANRTGGFEHAIRSVRAYFYRVARTFHEAENPQTRGHPTFQTILEDAQGFNKILRVMLSGEIEPSLNSQLQIVTRFRGRPFNPGELSNGEIVLAVWAIILHRQKEDLRGSYLLIDEPENHLHPDVCIRALTALRTDILGPHGQIWLATHSVPLIAHAGIESVHFVDNGAIEYAGNKIERVLDRLLSR